MRGIATLALLLILPAIAYGQAHPPCTEGSLEGSWVFFTDVGRFADDPLVPSLLRGKQITAVGTINFDGRGNIHGAFDQTVEGVGASRNQTFTGSVAVNADCTAIGTVTASTGESRTDSLVIMLGDQTEVRGMSLNHFVIWTFTLKQIGPRPR